VLSLVISSLASSISLSVKLGLAPTRARFYFGSFFSKENPTLSFFFEGDFLCKLLLFYLF
jgi:hypothetical protein